MCGIAAVVAAAPVQLRQGADGSVSNADELLQTLIGGLARRGPDLAGKVKAWPVADSADPSDASILLAASVLGLRGPLTSQPLCGDRGSVLAWNGEAYTVSGSQLQENQSDTEAVLIALDAATNEMEVCSVMASIRGPWAIILWHAATRSLWFGRDFFGRRSLLWAGEVGSQDLSALEGALLPELLLASVAPPDDCTRCWAEVPANGLYRICVDLNGKSNMFRIDRIEWDNCDDAMLRTPVAPFNDALPSAVLLGDAAGLATARLRAADDFLGGLERAVRRRIRWEDSTGQPPSVAVLFSGGVDCTVICAILHRVLPASAEVHLVNVAFENPRVCKGKPPDYKVPDRLTGEASVSELTLIFPERRWKFVAVDVPYAELEEHRAYVRRLVYPLNSVMDDSIGCALWFAVRGLKRYANGGADATMQRCPRVVLVGMGADEQLAGYSRHRTRFDKGGWPALAAEVRLDIDRISSRNLGRDDRCISDHSVEARFPFLDEDLVSQLNQMPVHLKTDPTLGRGIGEKRLIRDAARMVGLQGAAGLPKRAIQFGSRIAKTDSGKAKGSDAVKPHAKIGAEEQRAAPKP